MAEILLLSVPVFGHVKPMLAIARELVRRGHRVRWLAGAAFRERVEGTGASFCAFVEGFDYSCPELVPDHLQADRDRLRGLAKLRFDLATFFVGPCEGFCRDLLRLHEENPADLLVCDSFLMAGAWWAERTGRPWAQLCCTVLTLPSRALAPFGLALQPDDSWRGRIRNRMLRGLTRSVLFRSLRRRADQARQALELPSLRPWLFDVVSPHLVLSGTVRSFEYARPDCPPQVVFTGPLLENSDEAFTPPAWWGDLENATVVHVTQGTISNDPAQLLRPTLDALADEPVLVVACTGRSDEGLEALGPLPANARVASYIPYGALLPKTSLVVTNGGFQGVQAVLSHGIPMVTAGESEDKPEVCARLQRTGASIDLATATPEPSAIRAAVRRVLDEPSFSAAATALAREAVEAGGAVGAVDAIESVLRR
ncbi:MAG: glycosyltransferase [Vulcanococcus sp.]